MNAHLARLCVLFEDLRIEIEGLINARDDDSGRSDHNLKMTYYLRRSIGTLVEFEQAINLADRNADFRNLIARLAPDLSGRWNRANRFFKKHHRLLKKIRNDVGGHFGEAAAMYSVSNFSPTATGSIEVAINRAGQAAARLYFASEIATTALFKHLGKKPPEILVLRLFRLCLAGYAHSLAAVDSLVAGYLWDRFGR